VQGVPTVSNLGQVAAADTSLRKADEFLQRLLTADPGDPNALVRAAHVEQSRMIIADTERRDDDALAHTVRCGEYLERLMQSGRATPAHIRDALPLFSNVGLSYMNRGHLDEALRYDRRTVDFARSVGDDKVLAQSLSLLANTLRLTGDVDAALAPILEARRVAESSSFTSIMRKNLFLYGILIREGEILGADESISLNRPGEAIEPLRRAVALVEQLASQDPNDVTSRDRVATASRYLADILRHDHPRQALDIYDHAVEREREVKDGVRARRAEAQLLANASYPARALGRLNDARRRVDAAFDLLRVTGDYPAAAIPANGGASSTLRALADHLAATGETARSSDVYRELIERVVASRPEQDLQQTFELSRIYAAYARLLDRAGKRQEAQDAAARRLDLWRGWQIRSPGNPVVRQALLADARAGLSP
jgi:tetratricopeptide (TPR) repeat protein